MNLCNSIRRLDGDNKINYTLFDLCIITVCKAQQAIDEIDNGYFAVDLNNNHRRIWSGVARFGYVDSASKMLGKLPCGIEITKIVNVFACERPGSFQLIIVSRVTIGPQVEGLASDNEDIIRAI
jgi:hypothetical protein